jgi:hypothetical protein
MLSHFIDDDSCSSSGSDSYRFSFTLLLRGHSSLSGFSAAWLRAAFLLPLRGPPSFLIKKIGRVRRHLTRPSEPLRTGIWRVGDSCLGCPRKSRSEKEI